MTTINGKPVPGHYGSIGNLPEIIEELDHDQTAVSDGNYTEDEITWLHQFHINCGDRHYINDVDVASANIHGPTVFRKLDEKQQRDLVAYFSNVFPNYSTKPTQNHKQVQERKVTEGVTVDKKNTPHVNREKSIEDLGIAFVENILPESKKSLYHDAIEPLINQLSAEKKLALLKQLNSLDASVSEQELADNILSILNEYGLDDNTLYFLLANQYEVSRVIKNSTAK